MDKGPVQDPPSFKIGDKARFLAAKKVGEVIAVNHYTVFGTTITFYKMKMANGGAVWTAKQDDIELLQG